MWHLYFKFVLAYLWVAWDAVALVGLDDGGLARSVDCDDSVCDGRARKKKLKDPGAKWSHVCSRARRKDE